MYRIVFLGGEDVSARIDISKELIKKKCHIEILGTESPERFVESGIKYQQFYLNREFDVIGDIKSLLQIRKILKNYNKETVVHAFDTKLTVLLPLAAIGLGNIKVVRTINGMGRIFTTSNFKNKILSFVYKCIQKSLKKIVDYTIFQNTDNYNYFLENNLVKEENSGVVKSSGINLKNYFIPVNDEYKNKLRIELNINDKQPTFVLISRLIKQKGVLNYLEAAQKSFDNGYKFNFLLVGQIDSNKDAISIDTIQSYANSVKYLNKRSDVKEILSISDIFVFPSYYSEGVPRVLLEASASGLVLLTTDMPGCNDVVVDNYNGKIIEIKNSDDLFDKMIYVAKDKDRLKEYSKNSIEHVQNFSLELVTNKCFEIYKNV
jgi:glycosyltransferase involved in cell wall biosynthesis